MADLELIMKTDLDAELPSVIDFNFEQLRDELAIQLQKYDGRIVTEDGIKSAKDDRAALNKLKDALEARRIEVKKEVLRPYSDFEGKVKTLVGMIDQPVKAIDRQIKAFDQAKKDEKLNALKDFYASKIGDLASILPLTRILNPKWENAGMKLAKLQEEIQAAIERVQADLLSIESFHAECENQMKDAYLRSLNLSDALAEKQRYEDQKARLEEYARRQEEKARAVDVTPAPAIPVNEPETTGRISAILQHTQEEPSTQSVDKPEGEIIKLWIRVTKPEQVQAALTCFRENGIEYGRLD